MSVKRFAVGKFTVTVGEWDACVKGGGCTSDKAPGERDWGKGKRPVINVSWNDANEYVDWMNGKFGGRTVYRLLTESEWEYAARAGTTTRYFWSDSLIKNRSNCDGCGSEWDNTETAPVGSFQANAFGLHDMHGNVWQWTQDCYVDTYKNEPRDGSAIETRGCALRVLRGGSWLSDPVILRSAYRSILGLPGWSDSLWGFRLARTLLTP